MSFSSLIVKNLFRNKRRTLLTFLGILISFLLFVSIFTLFEAFNRKLKTESAQVNLFFRPIYLSNFIDGQIPEGYLHKLAKIPFIRYFTPYKIYLGTGRASEKTVFVIGVDPESIAKLRNLSGTSPIQLEKFQKEKKGAILGEEVLEANQWKVGEEIIIRGIRGLPDLPLHIVGSTDKKGDFAGAVVVHYHYLKDLLNDGGVFSIGVLRVEYPYQVPWAVEKIREEFENSSVPMEGITEKGFIESILVELAAIGQSIRFIAWITLIATLFVLGNTMAMSIRERSVEQGVLRTLGFSRKSVFSLYLAESILLAFIGGMLGGIIGCALFEKFEISLPSGQNRPPLPIPPYWEILKEVALLALAMGIFSGLPPAYFAARKKITQALRFAA